MQETAKPEPIETLQTTVLIPTARAITAGGFVGLGGFVLAVVFKWGASPFAVAAVGFVLVSVPAFFWFSAEVASRFNPAPPVVPATGREYNAETPVVNHKILTTWNDGKAGAWVEMTGTELEKFSEFASSIITGISFSENFWCGEGALFSKTEYYRMLKRLLERNMIERISSKRNSSYRVTGPGGGLFRYAARLYQEQIDTPSPTERGFPRIVRNSTVNELREHERV